MPYRTSKSAMAPVTPVTFPAISAIFPAILGAVAPPRRRCRSRDPSSPALRPPGFRRRGLARRRWSRTTGTNSVLAGPLGAGGRVKKSIMRRDDWMGSTRMTVTREAVSLVERIGFHLLARQAIDEQDDETHRVVGFLLSFLVALHDGRVEETGSSSAGSSSSSSALPSIRVWLAITIPLRRKKALASIFTWKS